MAFEVEVIPSEANLFRHVPSGFVVWEQNRPSSVCFKDERVSTNWEKYKAVEDTKRANSEAVLAIFSQDCIDAGQIVEHTPVEGGQPFGPNQAHVEICGKKDKPTMHKLARASRLVWVKPRLESS